jgi:hypothetical protein
MKLRSLPCRPLVLWLMVLLILVVQSTTNEAAAQMPDCLTNTYMYGLFSPKNTTSPASGFDSVEIREIRFSNASVGQLMGGRRYMIRKRPAAAACPTCPMYYGSSAMAMDPTNGRFYLVTQMGSGGSGGSTAFGDKDIIMIDPLAPTATGTVVATINDVPDGFGGPTNMDNYHFVKAAIAPSGFGYTIGVNRNSGAGTSTFNPIVRFTPCAVPSAGCADASLRLMGYISNDQAVSTGMNLFNGDITFDAAGNMYFFASALNTGTNRYTDSRLFRINAGDIPAAPTTGEVPIQFVADYNLIDTTGASGVVMDASGNLYMTLRNYDYSIGPNEYTTELHVSYDETFVQNMPAFGPIHDSLSAGDLAACYFASAILPIRDTKLSARYVGGNASLRWEVGDNESIKYFELQSSNDGDNFTTIATINAAGSGQDKGVYNYTDPNVSGHVKYYRVRKIMKSGNARFYSNVVKLALNGLNMVAKPSPNPFTESVNFQVELKSPQKIVASLIDQGGRVIIRRTYNGNVGVNSLKLNEISGVKPGIYILEVSGENEIIREKLVKQ